ncbi:MAG: DNA polymerase/3'-5' exonuclease PolX [Deltaproteobacteria bacterium]|nr:DNA polymerase/3'-5' exonuclease PolX [Deltaproteobacteria bacterium]
MDNVEIARFFNEISDLLEIKGENPFRVRSYRNAALVIEGLTLSLESIVEKDEKSLEDIPGIGKSIHEKIVEIIRTNGCELHEELLKEVPQGVLELLKVSGIGPRKAGLLYKKLGIQGVGDLEAAAKGHKLRDLPGMGERSEEKILRAIEDYKTIKASSLRFKLSVAYPRARGYIEYLKKFKGVVQVEAAGSLRRWKETVGDVDILVTCREAAAVMEHFVKYPDVKEVVSKGETKATVVLKSGLQVDLRALEKKSFGAALQYFTGSKSHNIAVRDRAKKMGLKISEYGVFSGKTGEMVAGEKEEDVYRAVGLPWIAPELRENMGEIEAAERGDLPDLIELSDIKGDLHVHSTFSDGASTMEELAEAAMGMGYEYMAVTDHSKAVGIAHGLDEKRLEEVISGVEAVNRRLEKKGVGFRLIKGAEVDIRADGTLDFSEGALKKLDCVVGAVHSGFTMTMEDMTRRIIKTMETGYLNVLAHPTGRLIGMREPYEVDMERVMDAAKEYGVALELNSFPERLDLNDAHLRLAKDKGVMVAISTDAHHAGHLDYVIYGVHTARRGWIEKKNVLNARGLKELMRLLKRGC